MNTAGPGLNTASEIDGGQFNDSTEVINRCSEKDCDSGNDKDTVGSSRDRRGVKREKSEFVALLICKYTVHPSCAMLYYVEVN